MKKIIFLLSVILIMGAGCVQNSPQPNFQILHTNSATVEQIEKITTDTGLWVRTDRSNGANFSQDVSFLRPPEFAVSGHDTDYGRVTLLEFNNQVVFKIVEDTMLLTCPKSICEGIDELVSVTPDKYIETESQRLKKIGVETSDQKFGNLLGKQFVDKNGQYAALVHFNKAVYRISEESLIDIKGNLFHEFVASFNFGA